MGRVVGHATLRVAFGGHRALFVVVCVRALARCSSCVLAEFYRSSSLLQTNDGGRINWLRAFCLLFCGYVFFSRRGAAHAKYFWSTTYTAFDLSPQTPRTRFATFGGEHLQQPPQGTRRLQQPAGRSRCSRPRLAGSRRAPSHERRWRDGWPGRRRREGRKGEAGADKGCQSWYRASLLDRGIDHCRYGCSRRPPPGYRTTDHDTWHRIFNRNNQVIIYLIGLAGALG